MWYQMIPAMVQGTVGLAQLGIGLSMKPKRPKYNTPGAVTEATSIARNMATGTRPGNEQAIADINRATASNISTAQRTSNSSQQVLSSANAANNARLRALSQNNALNAQFQFNAKQGLMAALNRLGSYQDKEWQLNKFDPYMDKAQTKAALISSGMQNFWASTETASNAMSFGGGGQGGGGGMGGMMGGGGGPSFGGGGAPKGGAVPGPTNSGVNFGPQAWGWMQGR